MTRLLPLLLVGAIALAFGCESEAEDDLDERRDDENSTFVSDGKTDSNGVEDRSWEASCVLNVANQATLDMLDDDMSLWSVAAKNIVGGRAGPDGEDGTSDDTPYGTLEALDAVSWVGFYAFNQLSKFARKNGYCQDLNEEFVPAGEQAAIEAVVASSVDHVTGKYEEGERPSKRDAHPKAHGCVKAFFEVDHSELPSSMRAGVFATHGATFPAWIRFSNGSFTISPDADGDIRGMAVKLMDVPGEKILDRHKDELTQDFLLINTPVLMVRNAIDYVEFSQKAFDGNPVTFFFGLNPLEWNLRELFITLKVLSKDIESPLLSRYWSTTPYKLGSKWTVKYSARPCHGEGDDAPDDAGDDYLSEVLAEQLAEGEGCFEFLMQVQADPEAMPIEDPSLEWDEGDSPYVKAGKIRVPSQTFLGDDQKAFCEHLSFNPWHSLPEHAPVGGINRARKEVYEAISELRHRFNAEPRVEPKDHTIPSAAN